MSDFDQRLPWVWWRETVARVTTLCGESCDECTQEIYVYFVHPGKGPPREVLCRECFDRRYRPKDASDAE